MTCERVEVLLSALIDQELDSKTEATVNEHLHACPSCAETLHDLQLLVKTSAELEPIAPPDRLFFAIRREARKAQPQSWFAPRRITWVLVPALATVALMLVIFYPRSQPTARVAAQPAAPAIVESPAPAASAAVPEAQPVVAPRSTLHPTRTPRRATPSVSPAAVVPVAASVPQSPQPAMVMAASVGPAGDAMDGLREIQQGLEEIEAAMHENPGNPQVVRAYQLTYRKGVELRDRYLVGTR